MISDDTHLILKIETDKPVELNDFVAAFLGLGNQFEQFYDDEHPSERGNVRFYVREVRAGSIIAELVPYLKEGVPAALLVTMAGIKYANDIAKFVENYSGKLKKYFNRGGREPQANKGDLADYLRTVQAVANDTNGSLSLAAYENGEQRAVFRFNTAEAKEAEHNLLEHRNELDKTTGADYERVIMTFTRTNVAHATTGKRSGELVEIEKIHNKALPIVYASALAEERIRHEITQADDNVYKKAFDVDVNVEMRSGKPIAFRLIAVHYVIDLSDD